jgi:phosphoribosylaminoimidazolecarboxamide formyltransferase/IMP cyclohydrolase
MPLPRLQLLARVTGGLLVQDKDLGVINENDIKCVSDTQPTNEQIKDLLF